MYTILYGYIDRENIEGLTLEIDGGTVPAETVTKVTLKFGDYCIDTDNDSDQIYFTDSNNQAISIKLGQVDSIAVGRYSGTLTIYDAETVNGLAWIRVKVEIFAWAVCPA